ncbi:hypothetical protein V8C86DRAFT_2905803 [Haematococcus lacustris]
MSGARRRSSLRPPIVLSLSLGLLLLSCSLGLGASQSFPSPPTLVAVPRPPSPPVPPLNPPLPPGTNATRPRISMRITFFGLDFFSIVTRQSSIATLVQGTSLTLSSLTSPPTCYSDLLSRNFTSLLGLSAQVSTQDLLPGLPAFTSDVNAVVTGYVADRNAGVEVYDVCASSPTNATFFVRGLPVTAFWPTVQVFVSMNDPAWCAAA